MLDELAGYEEQIIWNVTLSSASRQIVKKVCEALRNPVKKFRPLNCFKLVPSHASPCFLTLADRRKATASTETMMLRPERYYGCAFPSLKKFADPLTILEIVEDSSTIASES
jgi:hypothetical protein